MTNRDGTHIHDPSMNLSQPDTSHDTSNGTSNGTSIHGTHRAPFALGGLCVLAFLPLLALTSACVTENRTTGEMVPRGNQRYPWEKVQELAKRLQDGMTKEQVLSLMGSPAEVDSEDDQWVYLPERYAILVPAKALRLQFKDRLLIEHGYRAIVLGAQL